MSTIEILSFVFNVVLGGGWMVTVVSLRSKAKQAAAEARADELKNVESAIKIWREIAEGMSDKYNELMERCDTLGESVNKLTTEVGRLRLTNNKIVRLLDKITPENLEHVVTEIKNELDQVKG